MTAPATDDIDRAAAMGEQLRAVLASLPEASPRVRAALAISEGLSEASLRAAVGTLSVPDTSTLDVGALAPLLGELCPLLGGDEPSRLLRRHDTHRARVERRTLEGRRGARRARLDRLQAHLLVLLADERHELDLAHEGVHLLARDVLQDRPLAARAADTTALVQALREEARERLARQVADRLPRVLAADHEEAQEGVGEHVADDPLDAEVLGVQRARDREPLGRACDVTPGPRRCDVIAISSRTRAHRG